MPLRTQGGLRPRPAARGSLRSPCSPANTTTTRAHSVQLTTAHSHGRPRQTAASGGGLRADPGRGQTATPHRPAASAPSTWAWARAWWPVCRDRRPTRKASTARRPAARGPISAPGQPAAARTRQPAGDKPRTRSPRSTPTNAPAALRVRSTTGGRDTDRPSGPAPARRARPPGGTTDETGRPPGTTGGRTSRDQTQRQGPPTTGAATARRPRSTRGITATPRSAVVSIAFPCAHLLGGAVSPRKRRVRAVARSPDHGRYWIRTSDLTHVKRAL
jgi:hypothetical protein